MTVEHENRSSLEPVGSVAGGWSQIHLIGFMGAGKSTVGRLLARRLLWNYLDLDVLIERHADATIADIFAERGESGFRELEAFVLRQAVQKPRSVLALGGGTFVERGNVETSRARGVSVWLRCSVEIVRQRLGRETRERPLWDPGTAARRMELRRPAYACADLAVDAEGEPAAVAEAVLRLLEASAVRPDDAVRAGGS